MTTEELLDLMNHYYGTEYYHPVQYGVDKLLLTDGALAFAEKAGAFWFIQELNINLLPKAIKKAMGEWLFTVKLIVKGDKADIKIYDCEDNVVASKHIAYTDCPEGVWMFFYDVESKVLLWKNEY